MWPELMSVVEKGCQGSNRYIDRGVGSYGKAPLVKQLTLEDMRERYKNEKNALSQSGKTFLGQSIKALPCFLCAFFSEK